MPKVCSVVSGNRINGDTAGACDNVLTDRLAQLIAREVLPRVPELLREEKPIPVWALKVVEECLESLPDMQRNVFRVFSIGVLL